MSDKIVLLDGHSILNRAFYGVPDLSNAEGLHTNAVYGFLNILFKILDEEQPQYLAVAFDLHAPTFRHKMYDQYKGTRKPMPQELREQVPVIQEVLAAMDIEIVTKEGYEADDILGTLGRKCEAEGMEVTIVSGDRDLLQLATDHILIRIPKTVKRVTTIENYHTAEVLEKYSLLPKQIIDLKALMGDTADNIPGLPGVGEKTATKILLQYETLENAHAHFEEIKPNKAKEAMRDHYDLAELSKKLATIDTDAPVELDREKAALSNFYTPKAYEMFKRLEFKKPAGPLRGDECRTRGCRLSAHRNGFFRGGRTLWNHREGGEGRSRSSDRRNPEGRTDGRSEPFTCRYGSCVWKRRAGCCLLPSRRFPDRRLFKRKID